MLRAKAEFTLYKRNKLTVDLEKNLTARERERDCITSHRRRILVVMDWSLHVERILCWIVIYSAHRPNLSFRCYSSLRQSTRISHLELNLEQSHTPFEWRASLHRTALPEWWVSVSSECEGDCSGALFLSTNPKVVIVFCRVVNSESPLRRSLALVWSETDS